MCTEYLAVVRNLLYRLEEYVSLLEFGMRASRARNKVLYDGIIVFVEILGSELVLVDEGVDVRTASNEDLVRTFGQLLLYDDVLPSPAAGLGDRYLEDVVAEANHSLEY